MKKMLTLFFVFAAFGLHAGDLLIRDINLIPMTGHKVIKKQCVLIRDGKIRQIGSFTAIKDKEGATVIDGKGKYLMPGLADMHVHLPEPAKTDTMLLMQVAAGVTHMRITNSRNLQQQELRKKLAADPELISPHLVYSHLIGKLPKATAAQLDSLMLALKQDDIRLIKVFSVSSEAAFDQLMLVARQYGITVYGHFPQYAEGEKMISLPLEKVLGSGFSSIEHLGGYEELEKEDALQQAVQQTKRHKVYNCPTLDWDLMAFDQLYPDAYKQRITYSLLPKKYIRNWEAKYAADVEKAGGRDKVMADRDRYRPTLQRKQKVLKLLADAGCPLLLGGDATGNFQAAGFNLYEEMHNWSRAGLDNYTILKSATVTPAAFFNESAQWGTIETGKAADLIILDKNPLEDIKNIATVRSTIINGHVYHKQELIALL